VTRVTILADEKRATRGFEYLGRQASVWLASAAKKYYETANMRSNDQAATCDRGWIAVLVVK
jgi:hypothetical protein